MAYLGGLGSNFTKTTGQTLAITASSNIPAGTLLILGVGWDNIDAATPTITSVSASGGGTWSPDATGNSGVAGGPTAGIFAAVYTTTTTTQINSGSTITTITWSSASTTVRAAAIVGHSGQIESFRGAIISASNTTGTPSAATTTAPVTGDVVIGVVIAEDNSVPTADADTLNGSWSSIYGTAATGGNANTNVAVGIQSKTVTAGGNQTFNPVAGTNDAVAFVFTLATPLAATASGNSATFGDATAIGLYKPIIDGGSLTNGSLPSMSAVNTFVLSANSTTTGSAFIGIRSPASASGNSLTNGSVSPIGIIPFSGTANNTLTTGSLAAFRAVGIGASGGSISTGTGAIKATLAPIMIGSSVTTGSAAAKTLFKPILTGSSTTTGSAAIRSITTGSMNAFTQSTGSIGVGLVIRNNSASGSSASNGSANGNFSVSTTFIGWGSPL